MSNPAHAMQQMAQQAAAALLRLLDAIPVIEVKAVQHAPDGDPSNADILLQLKAAGKGHGLIGVVKPSGQPRHVRHAIMQLQAALGATPKAATGVFIAPYLTPAARAMCRDRGVGYLDMEGNAWLAFGGIYIERHMPGKPLLERRELRSLFSPKSSRVLRALLAQPERSWRVAELAATSGVSLGHVSNVRSGLLDREWASITGDGLVLETPHALLDAWQHSYQQGVERRHFYTALHGIALDNAARRILSTNDSDGRAAFSSFSAAQWLSPYARTGLHYFYADEDGMNKLISGLKLSPVSAGENIVITLPKDESVLLDTVEPAPGAICTSAVQTYLDLSVAGERGKEAALHLRQELLAWPA
jgi:hypothetical protein